MDAVLHLAVEYLKEIETEYVKITMIRPPTVYGKSYHGNMKKLELCMFINC